jgi:hypothetical protein
VDKVVQESRLIRSFVSKYFRKAVFEKGLSFFVRFFVEPKLVTRKLFMLKSNESPIALSIKEIFFSNLLWSKDYLAYCFRWEIPKTVFPGDIR